MSETSFGATLPSSVERDVSLDQFGVVDVADLLLLGLVRHKLAAIVIEPVAQRHAVRYEQGGTIATLASLDAALGDAVVARLAILAELDVAARGEQVGRLRVRAQADHNPLLPAPVPTDLLVVIRPTARGLIAELRRIVGPEDEVDVAPVAPGAAPEGLVRVGPYRVLGELGRGGMGVVYRAEHVVLQKPVAIKVLGRGVATDPAFVARFILEARAACRARHPGIVDVTDFGRLPDQRAYIVMELVEGETLEGVLRGGPLPAARAVGIARQIAEALRAASGCGVVHRDLKPANIFVGPGDRVKIGDFGVAKVMEHGGVDTDEPSTILGTVGYMSPEQAQGASTDGRTDLYALGCVLFEMLTGQPPYTGDTAAEVLGHHISSPIPALSGADGAVPDVVADLVTRAMAKRPEERHQSAGELLADLERAALALARTGWRRWLAS